MRPEIEPRRDLDRIWAATRPGEPSPATLDALWLAAARELDRIAADPAPLILARPDRSRRWPLAWAALASAAALLVAAGIALARRGGESAPIAQVRPTPATTITPTPTIASTPVAPPVAPEPIVVEPGRTAMVHIDNTGHRVRFLTDPAESASSVLPEGTAHDVFNSLESMAAL